MEYKGITSVVKSEEIILPDRLETNFEQEIDEEHWAVMENVKSEVDTTVSTEPAVSPKNHSAQSSEECLQFYKVRLPLRCRLCAIPYNDMVDIFDPIETDKRESILEKIECCLPIVVKLTDPLPKQACQSCLANLELCYQFQKIVVDAERQLLAFEILTKTKINCLSSPRCNDSINGRSKRSSGAETSSSKQRTVSAEAQTADTTVKSSSKLADLKPCSVVLMINETLGKNNLDRESMRSSSDDDSSMDTFDAGQTSAFITDRQSTCSPEVPGKTRSRILSLQSGKGGKHRDKPANHQQGDKEGPVYTCDLCPRTFRSKGAHLRHENIHTNKGRYSCLYCNKRFTWLSGREAHHRVHTGDRPFKCAICDKVFAWKYNLKAHLAVHSEVRNHPCSLCDKSFKSLSSRNSHMKTHSADKPWQCDYCKIHFLRKGHMQNHLRYCTVRYPLPKEFLQSMA